MRPDHPPEAELKIGPRPQGRVNPIGATDHEGRVLPPGITPCGKLGGEVGAGQKSAPFIQYTKRRAVRNDLPQQQCLGLHPAAALVFDFKFSCRAKAKWPPGPVKPLQVIIHQSALWPSPQAANGAKVQPHQS